MAIVRWNPMRDLLDVEREFNSLFRNFQDKFGFGIKEESGNGGEMENAVWMPLTDVYEDNDFYKLKMDLPGIKKEDVKISYADGQLTISGERKQEKETDNSKYHRIERSFGRYYRNFTLPKMIVEDKIDAEFKDGQLIVNIPKAEEAKPKELEIKVK